MKILLDTCSFIWALEAPEQLSETAARAFTDFDNRLFVSVVSVWEAGVKYRLGRLRLSDPPEVAIPQALRDLKLEPLNLDIASALLVSALPQHHKDPFDRMLVCQAMHHELTVLTPDRLIQQYGVSCLW